MKRTQTKSGLENEIHRTCHAMWESHRNIVPRFRMEYLDAVLMHLVDYRNKQEELETLRQQKERLRTIAKFRREN